MANARGQVLSCSIISPLVSQRPFFCALTITLIFFPLISGRYYSFYIARGRFFFNCNTHQFLSGQFFFSLPLPTLHAALARVSAPTIYVYVYIQGWNFAHKRRVAKKCMYVCVCVCVRARVYVCVCVCVCNI